MINHMPEVAKMLGVEIGEEFYIGPYNATYVIREDGLYSTSSEALCSDILIKLLNGIWAIKRKPWKPFEGEDFFYIDQKSHICSGYFHEKCLYDINLYKLGNCYRTKEEAEANRDKWVAFYASDEVLEV